MRIKKTQKTAKKSIDIVRGEMESQRTLQVAAIDSLDTKAGLLLGFESLLFVGLISAGDNSMFYTIGFGGILLSLGCLVWSMQLRRFKFNPSPDALVDDYMFREINPDKKKDKTRPSSKEQILVDQREAYKQNEMLVKSKGFWLKISLWLLLVSVIIIGINRIGGERMAKEAEKPRKGQEQVASPNPSAENTHEYSEKPAVPNPNASNTIEKSMKSGKK
jgi:hypothetical protein